MRKSRLWGLLLACALLLQGCGGDPAVAVPGASPTPSEPPASAPASRTPELTQTPEPVAEPTPTPTPTPEPPPPTVATLAVCGDVMSHMPITTDAYDQETDTYRYTRLMAAAQPYVETADYAVANLETTLAGGPSYSGYPQFHSPDALAYDLKELGFDLMLTANNHCMDTRWKGLSRTLDVLDEAGLAHVGTSRSEEEEAENLVVADVGGISVAFLGYTYGTNGIPLPEDKPYAVNLFNLDYMTNLSQLDTDRLLEDLEQAKALETDLVAVMIHWGVEYQTKENRYQDTIADLLIANGADLVLGGHPHVLQPMEMRTAADENGVEHTGFVCYSLGNFISSQNKTLTDVTVVLTLELTRDNVSGETSVTGWQYQPMLMLDREEGEERFELLDVYKTLALEGNPQSLIGKLEGALEACHTILGAEGDAGAS